MDSIGFCVVSVITLDHTHELKTVTCKHILDSDAVLVVKVWLQMFNKIICSAAVHMSCFLLKTCQDSSRLTAGTMCLRLKSFRWQPMFIAVNHAFTASCNVHSQCDTMPQYLIEQCLPQFVHYVSTSNHFDTIFCAHGVKICITSVTALRPRFQISQIWRFFFNLKRFDTIWCGHFLRTCNAFNAAMPNSRMRQIGHSPRSARPQNLRGWSMLIALSILAKDICYKCYKCTLNATASYSFLQLHVFANVSNMSESATNTSQGACMACTQCWPDCPYKLHIGPGKMWPLWQHVTCIIW